LTDGEETGKGITLFDDFESGSFNKYNWTRSSTNTSQSWVISSNESGNKMVTTPYSIGYKSQERSLSITLSVTKNSIFSFDCNMWSGMYGEKFELYINSNLKQSWSGYSGWSKYTTTLLPGNYKISFVYKNISYSNKRSLYPPFQYPSVGWWDDYNSVYFSGDNNIWIDNVKVYNEGTPGTFSSPTNIDTDNDGITDGDEVKKYNSDPSKTDTDGDGLSDYDEITIYKTNPSSIDTDSDMLFDNEEIFVYKTDPLIAVDTDGDGLTDGSEVKAYKSNISKIDTDNDGLPDGDEAYLYHTKPAFADSDDDQLSDFDEVMIYHTNPNDIDTDDDYLWDGNEIFNFHTDPLVNGDADNDGLKDNDELAIYQTDPNKADTDGDGLSDPEEIGHGCDPNKKDTDGDKISDYDEIYIYYSNPKSIHSDSDGLTDYEEVFVYKTDPIDCDTDSDGLYDDQEVKTYYSNPLKYDTDDDGLDDWYEVHNFKSSPTKQDTDNDGLIDSVEVGVTLSDGFESGNFGGLLWLPNYSQVNYNGGGSGGGSNSGVVWQSVSDSGYSITIYDSSSVCISAENLIGVPLIYNFNNGDTPLYDQGDVQPSETSLSWNQTGNYLWKIVNTETSGFWIAASSPDSLPDNQSSSLKLLVVLPRNILLDNQIRLSFDYRVSSEQNGDYFSFIVNSSTYDIESGEVPWTNLSCSLKPGVNLIEFKYSKNGINSAGLDKVWIDNFKIKITGYGTSPSNPDSDGDGMPDGYEVTYFLNPLSNADRNQDADGDGLTNIQEFEQKTNPQLPDTDDDGLTDREELMIYSSNPFIIDVDNDGVMDGLELKVFGTNLKNADSDGDGLTDGEELGTIIYDGFQRKSMDKYNWVTTGDFPWEITKDVYYYDVFSACSPDCLLDNQSSSMKITVNVKKSADYSFYYTVSSEQGHDFLELIIDSQVIQQWSGAIDWQLFCGTLSAGTHTIEFRYIKDDKESYGYDQASIDAFCLYNYGYGTNPLSVDTDSDGLTDDWEIANSLDPLSIDSDNDTMADGWEIANSLDPLVNDADLDNDNDSVTNAMEHSYKCNPNSSDSDNDGLTDSEEINIYHTNPAVADTDADGLSDTVELTESLTDPLNPDMDGDGVSDGKERSDGSNPFLAEKFLTSSPASANYSTSNVSFEPMNFAKSETYDVFYVSTDMEFNLPCSSKGYSVLPWYSIGVNINSDTDRIPDWWETIFVTDKNNDDADMDYDCDSLVNGVEYLIGTNPHNADTDLDGMPDNYEYLWKTDPLIADSHLDFDSDGLTNLEEMLCSTDPYNPDTDGDGVSDGTENANGTDPLNAEQYIKSYSSSEHYCASNVSFAPANFTRSVNYDVFYVSTDMEFNLPCLSNGYSVLPWYSIGVNINSDTDRMPDWWETIFVTDKNNDDADMDYDCDSLVNGVEYLIGTNPHNADTDLDGMPDNYEYLKKTDPSVADAHLDYDDDGLSNLEEMMCSSDPHNPDTDGDGVLDGTEKINGTNPVFAETSKTCSRSSSHYSINIETINSSGNINSSVNYKNINSAIMYYTESSVLSLSCLLEQGILWNYVIDRDCDGIPNLWEIANNGNPDLADSTVDGDSDTLSNIIEYQIGTSGLLKDTDGDSQDDGFEYKAGTNPLDPSSIFFCKVSIGTNGLSKIKWPGASGRFYKLMVKDYQSDSFKLYYDHIPSQGNGENECFDTGLDLNGDGKYDGTGENPPSSDINIKHRLYKIVVE